MKTLVIGSNSFSGASFVDHALASGHEVLGVSRSPQVAEPFRRYLRNPNIARHRFLQLDVNNSSDQELAAVKGFAPNLVVNYAAQSMVGESWERPEDWYQTNVVSLAQLVNFLSSLDSLEKYVHITTPEVYGSTRDWISEGEPFDPSTPYAVSRAAGDLHLRVMQREKGFPVVFTRAANVYGSGQQLYRVIPKAFLSALSDKAFPLHGGGNSRRSFIHISDVDIATMRIAEAGRIGEDYHISTTQLVSIRDLVSQVFALCGREFDAEQASAQDRPGKDAGYFLSSEKLTQELGWRAKIELLEGLTEVLDWVIANQELFDTLPWEYKHRK